MGLLAASLLAARSPVVGSSVGYLDPKQDSAQLSQSSQAPACTRFIEEGIRELIKARRILCGSYVYGMPVGERYVDSLLLIWFLWFSRLLPRR